MFVTDDGAETDLDLGHYERFTGVPARATDSVSAGRIYWTVLTRERHGDYLGGTVQVIPHVTNAIKEFIENDTEDADIVLCEIGGTVGDIEGLPFLEAIRQFGLELRAAAVLLHPRDAGALHRLGAGAEDQADPALGGGAARRSASSPTSCSAAPTARSRRTRGARSRCSARARRGGDPGPGLRARSTRCRSPITSEGLDTQLLPALGLPRRAQPDLAALARRSSAACSGPRARSSVAIVGKYTGLFDAYKSLNEALVHGGIANNVRVNLHWIDAEEFAHADQHATACTA